MATAVRPRGPRRRAAAAARSAHRGGRHAERNLPKKSWIVGESTLELSDHHWNAEDRYIEGSTV